VHCATMKFLLALVFVGLVFGDDDDCHKQLANVKDCIGKNKDAIASKLDAGKTDIAACFTAQNCDVPDPSLSSQVVQQWENQPQAVKDCIKKDFKTATLTKLNECLDKKGVKQIQVPEMDDHDVFGEQIKGDVEKFFKNLIAIKLALKKCQKDKGDDVRRKILDCMQPIKDKAKAEVCKLIDTCKSGVSDACRARGKEIKDAVCKCTTDALVVAKGKVEDLQKKNADVELDFNDLKDLHGDEFGPMGKPDFDKLEKCYNDSNTPLPPFFSTAKSLAQGTGPIGILKQTKPKVTQAQLQEIHDSLEERIKNPDCVGC